MNILKNMKLGTMLGSGFFLIIAIGFMVAIFGRVQLSGIGENVNDITENRLPNVLRLKELQDNANLVARATRNLALLEDEASMLKEKARIDEVLALNEKTIVDLQKAINSEEGRALLKTVMDTSLAYYKQSVPRVVTLGLANKMEEARDLLMGEMRQQQNAYFNAIEALSKFQINQTAAAGNQAETSIAGAGRIMLILAVASAVLGAFVARIITRTVKAQIGGEPSYATEVAQQVAKGNLAVDVELRRGDTSSVLAAMGAMRSNLAQIVSEVRKSSESIATGAGQIAVGNADLSQRTEEQASNLEETAASMEEMSSTIKNNAETVKTATQLATSASETASRGGEVVGNVVRTMDDITTSSRKISEIIGVIDSIAFQTNILALNAAVEAARAGEQGRGFAVVASEVRTLAQRSAQAAKEIKSLIEESVSKVESGSQLVEEAGATMDEIVNQVRRVADLIGEIGSATHEQTQGVSQVSDAVSQLDQVTQQNAALVEESAAAAESLNQQGSRLVELVSVFQLGTAQGASSLAAIAQPAKTAVSHVTQKPALPVRKASPAIAHAPQAAGKDDDWETF
ncbi:methyl-accepting chemotaxis protein [uncultured Oxalicibacterium sp.]|uniref:methyl-accepting chemotaxis protein n=1 Tax=uncultured Oxalicibacterium sp. TaxID=1168540 RepID=UPI0025D55A03|nr:methyl-accepting chemotaxis protein [uncultured Oxalicibacterium sp.]